MKELIEQPPYSIKFDLSEIRLQSLSQEKRLSLMREIVTSMSNEPLWIYYVAVRILNNNAVYSNDGKFINRGKPRKQILPPNFDWWKSERLKRHRVIQEQAPLEGLRSLLPDYGVGNPLSRQPDPGRHPLELKNRRLSKK